MFYWSSDQSSISVTGNIWKTFAKKSNIRNNKGVLKKEKHKGGIFHESKKI